MTITELLEKRKQLLAEVDGADEKRFAQIQFELNKLEFQIGQAKAEERKAEEDAEKRAARPKNENGGSNNKVVLFDNKVEERSDEVSDEKILRTAKIAFGKQVRSALLKTPVNLSAGEKRALGVAVTTTAQNYTEPTDDVDGINNGGVFIPQTVLKDLLEQDAPDSPFLRDVKMKHIKGVAVFPYVITSKNGEKKSKGENKESDERSIKWGKLTLPQGNYPLTIVVTMELLNMTDEEFTDYLLEDLANEMNWCLADEVFYGTGKDNRIEGVTIGAIQGTAYETGKVADAIKDGLLKLSRRARKKAKIYIASDVSIDLTFEKDSTGRYIFPIYNNSGIETIAKIPVEVDDSLHDGEFIIGNAQKYLLNMTQSTAIFAEVKGKTRTIEYTAHLMVAGRAVPDMFYYGKKATGGTSQTKE